MPKTCLFRLISVLWITLLPGAVASYARPDIAAMDLAALAVLIVLAVVGLIWYPLRRMMHPGAPRTGDAGFLAGAA